ncbi:MAG TPA: HD-GYP domain-containing protein [Gaiellaceae bacterium]|nr:HD-GYP domain-containing protein [Gaiellaceae bacterium]
MTSAAAELSDELVRDARARLARRGLEAHARTVFALGGLAALAGIVATAVFVHGGPSFSLFQAALFAVIYAVVSRVTFEIGTGSAVPTQLVLVPMLFALPIGAVPAVVAVGLILQTLAQRPWPLRNPARVLPLMASAAHALGPALVIGLAHGLPLRWSAWPVYVAALAAQFAFDFGNTSLNATANRVPLATVANIMRLVYLVDAALAPVGLVLAFATRAHTELVILALPLVALLRNFSRERKQRIDHALELSDAYRGTAFLLGDVVEADDAYTGTHSRHVVDLVLGVADELELTPSDRRDAEFVALLHDVGKIRIPGSIINKPGPLTVEERALMETHTIEGEQMLERVGGLLGHVGRLVRSCHEHWDGNGYPDRLARDDIPLVARIVCACDAYSAMTTDRPYRKARSQGDAIAELLRCAGTQFDPQVVAALIRVSAGG